MIKTNTKKSFLMVVLSVYIFTFLFGMFSVTSYANTLGDLEGSSLSSGTVSQDDQDVADWISNQRGMTGEQLETATSTLSPITNFFGYIVGGIVVLIFGGIFIITALDLLFIAIPPVRGLLYSSGQQQQGGQMVGNQMQAQPKNFFGQLISDEAVQCSMMMGLGNASQQGGTTYNNYTPYNSGYNNYNQVNQQQPNMSTKSVIATYFKKRVFFMVLLALAVIVLTSSALLGTGVNLAQWVLKLIGTINDNIPK